uniref:Uncharacterized protein n=1 Tax=Arundo donax TaxID=35708 RepID=A0A0A8ZGF9_ARUDO
MKERTLKDSTTWASRKDHMETSSQMKECTWKDLMAQT